MTEEEKETFERMREVINKQSKTIRQMNEKLNNLENIVKRIKAKLAAKDYIQNYERKNNPFGGLF